jgi:hypothetical protein
MEQDKIWEGDNSDLLYSYLLIANNYLREKMNE